MTVFCVACQTYKPREQMVRVLNKRAARVQLMCKDCLEIRKAARTPEGRAAVVAKSNAKRAEERAAALRRVAEANAARGAQA